MKDLYSPIACSLHDEYEIAIMHKKHLQIKWVDDANLHHIEVVLPTDILVKNKEEFLLALTKSGEEVCIRLDRITLKNV